MSVFSASASLQNPGEGVIARESGVHADLESMPSPSPDPLAVLGGWGPRGREGMGREGREEEGWEGVGDGEWDRMGGG